MLRIVRACAEPGCSSLALKARHLCRPHYNRYLWTRWNQSHQHQVDKENRSKLLAQWLTRPKCESPNPRPLTPHEQVIYKRELNRILTKFPPQSAIRLSRLSGLASKYARRGGKAAYQRYCGIQARVAGWRRKWLREGTYDHALLEKLLTEAKRKGKFIHED